MSYGIWKDKNGKERRIPMKVKEDGTLAVDAVVPIPDTLTVKEIFSSDDLEDGLYTATGEYNHSMFGFSIMNVSEDYLLTAVIGDVRLPIPPLSSFYDEFDIPTPFEIGVEGAGLIFVAYLKG